MRYKNYTFLYRHKTLKGGVFMDFQEDEVKEKMEEARLLNEALEDVKEGRVLDGKEALLKLREKYGI